MLWFIKTTRSGARDSEGNLPPEIWKEGEVHPTLNTFDLGESRTVSIVFHPHMQDGARVQDKTSHTLTAAMGTGGNNTPMVLAVDTKNQTLNKINQTIRSGSASVDQSGAVLKNSQVRRLTPVECERLQGFPDNWTDDQADSHRYKQIGNAVAVPVVDWIVGRLVDYDNRK
jgi:DNA (cytosine-5)-methyltransferase 1